MNDRLALSVQEMADLLGIGRSSAWKLVNEGAIRSLRVGRRVIVPRSAVEAWLEQSAAETG